MSLRSNSYVIELLLYLIWFFCRALRGILDAMSSVVVTADGVMRGPKAVQLKAITDKACEIAAKELRSCLDSKPLRKKDNRYIF